MQSVCRPRLDETPDALKPRRRDREMNQLGKPISVAEAEAVHLSKMKLAAMVTAVCATALVAFTLADRSTAAPANTTQAKPTVVLVHGAWANNASWAGVIERLQSDGYTVYAPSTPLRSLKGDAAFVADFLKTIPGAIVLVGHSYGGMVITNAATTNPKVKALVYVDAFAPAAG